MCPWHRESSTESLHWILIKSCWHIIWSDAFKCWQQTTSFLPLLFLETAVSLTLKAFNLTLLFQRGYSDFFYICTVFKHVPFFATTRSSGDFNSRKTCSATSKYQQLLTKSNQSGWWAEELRAETIFLRFWEIKITLLWRESSINIGALQTYLTL